MNKRHCAAGRFQSDGRAVGGPISDAHLSKVDLSWACKVGRGEREREFIGN